MLPRKPQSSACWEILTLHGAPGKRWCCEVDGVILWVVEASVCHSTKGRNYDILRRKVHIKIFLFSFYFKINWTRIHCMFTSREATQAWALVSPPPRELSAVLKHSLSCSHVMEESPSVALDHNLFTFEKSSWVPLHYTICRLWHTPYMLKNNLQPSNSPEACLVSPATHSCPYLWLENECAVWTSDLVPNFLFQTLQEVQLHFTSSCLTDFKPSLKRAVFCTKERHRVADRLGLNYVSLLTRYVSCTNCLSSLRLRLLIFAIGDGTWGDKQASSI